MPILLNCDAKLLMKLHKLIVAAARYVIGNACYRMSTMSIMGKCNWLSLYQRIVYSSLSLFYKIIENQRPMSLYQYYIVNNTRSRTVKRSKVIYTARCPKSKEVNELFIYKTCELYSYLPMEIQNLSIKKFNTTIKTHIYDNFPFNKLYNRTDEYPP